MLKNSSINLSIKKQIFDYLKLQLELNLEISKETLHQIKESQATDTKSSVGDKFETGREMMQIELDKAESQKQKFLTLISVLEKLDLNKTFNQVEFGSLVQTNFGIYFISIGIGTLKIEGNDYFCISLASPIGKVLVNKSVGDRIKFQSRELKILSIC